MNSIIEKEDFSPALTGLDSVVGREQGRSEWGLQKSQPGEGNST